jgi:hypothetical protein
MMFRTAGYFGLILVAALSASTCARAQARAIPDVPLDMPAPPPRLVESSEPDMPAPLSLPGEPARTTPSRPRQPPAPKTTDVPRTVEPPKVDTPPVDAVAKPPEEPKAPPPTTLQTTPAQREGEVERRIRTQITQATTTLNRIDYQALNTDARTQYDTAKRFAAQAEEALRAKNLVFSANLAEKAVALSAQLSGR